MSSIHAPSKTTARETLQTTLYDLVAVVSEVAGADDEASIIATVMHILNFYDARCIGDFEGYRLLCEVETPLKDDDSAFYHFESSVAHFERMDNGAGGEGKEFLDLAVLTD